MQTATAPQEAFLYEQVEDLVTAMIGEGVLRPGERVPSLRHMSRQARVSIATVSQAYAELERKGFIEARPKSGFYVRPPRGREPSLPRMPSPAANPRRVRKGDLIDTIFAGCREPGLVSLGVANPSPELLPSRALSRSMSRVVGQAGVAGLEYCFPPGADELRRQIAYRSADLGCAVSPEEVLVTSGATESLAIAVQSVARPGDVIAVESPAYFLILRLMEQLGMLVQEVRTDPERGLCVESLAEIVERVPVRAVVTVTNFHNPLGAAMPEDRKRALVELLARHEIPLIDDDLYGDLSFEEPRPRLAKAYDRDGLVLTSSSFSKTLAPGYRVGWLLAGRYQEQAMHWKQAMSGSTPTLCQLAIADFLRTGDYDRHLRRIRRVYRDQVERMRFLIAEHFPSGTRVSRPQGGFVLWVELPRGVDGETLFEHCMRRHVSITPGTLFSPSRKFRNFVRLSCGMPWSERVEQAVLVVAEEASALAAMRSN